MLRPFADQKRVIVTAQNILARIGLIVPPLNAGEAADVREHAAELIVLLPRGIECANAAGRDAGNRAAIGVLTDVVLCLDVGQNLIAQEARVPVRDRIVLDAPHLLLADRTWLNEHLDHHRNLFLGNQVVHDSQGARCAVSLDQVLAILPDHERRGNVLVVLRGHIDPVVALHAIVNLAGVDDFFRQRALWHAGPGVRIGTVRWHICRATSARAIHHVIETMHRAGLQPSRVVPEIALPGARHRPNGAVVDVNLRPHFGLNGPDKVRTFTGERRPLLELLFTERGAKRFRKIVRLLASQLDQLRRRKLVGGLCRDDCEGYRARKKRSSNHGSVLYVNRDFMTERLYYTDSYLREFHARV